MDTDFFIHHVERWLGVRGRKGERGGGGERERGKREGERQPYSVAMIHLPLTIQLSIISMGQHAPWLTHYKSSGSAPLILV